MKPRFTRRDFLKVASMAPLLGVRPSGIGQRKPFPAEGAGAENILVILFDTLSARHIGLYGYARDTMPNLARFAERATVYHAHHSAGNYTTPSTGSFFTGTYPWRHRALSHQSTVDESYVARNLFSAFGDNTHTRVAFSQNYLVNLLLYQLRKNLDAFTLPSDIALVDYNFSDQAFFGDYVVASRSERAYLKKPGKFSNSLFLFPIFWLLKTFDQRRIKESLATQFPRGVPGYHDMFYPLNETIDWIAQQLQTLRQPFLAYMHLMPPHDPSAPSAEFVNIFWDGYKPLSKPPHVFWEGHPDWFLNEQAVYYDEYIAYVDSEFGRLHDFLEKGGFLENTWVVFTSDHGELFERGIWKHTTRVLYEPVVHVPLLISAPGQRVREDVYVPTSTVDLLPSLLHFAGKPVPDWCEGKVLPPFGKETDRAIYIVEAKSNPKAGPLVKATLAMIKGKYKLIKYVGYEKLRGYFELYDLENDPEEMNNLIESNHPMGPQFQDELNRKIEQVNEPYLR